jgi:hypothetical protein
MKTKEISKINKDSIGTHGRFRFECLDKDGKLKWRTKWFKNLTTNGGKAQMAALIGSVVTPFTYLAVGTSNTAPAATQTTLAAEITTGGLARQSATFSLVTTTTTNDTMQLQTTWTTITLPCTVQEMGYFNASSGGVMGGRGLPVSGSRAVVAGDQLVGTYQIQLT